MTLQMSYQEKFEQGVEQERERGIRCLVESLRGFRIGENEIKEEIMKKYHLSEKEAAMYL